MLFVQFLHNNDNVSNNIFKKKKQINKNENAKYISIIV